YLKNKERYAAHSKRWWNDNRDKLRAKWRRRSKSPSGRLKASRYRERNLDRVRAGRRNWQSREWAHRQDYMRAYYQNHKEEIKSRVKGNWESNKSVSKVYSQNRRARKLNTTIDPKGIRAFYKRVHSRPTFCCYYCGHQFLTTFVH